MADAELIEKRATQQSPRTFSAELSGIGALTVAYEVYEPLVVGRRYRVTYSPRTRRAWAVEALEMGRRRPAVVSHRVQQTAPHATL